MATDFQKIQQRSKEMFGKTGFTTDQIMNGLNKLSETLKQLHMNTGNRMIDGDNGRDYRSPHYKEPEECKICEGTGRVVIPEENEGITEYVTAPCSECGGEGVIE